MEHFPEKIQIAIRHGRLERRETVALDLDSRLEAIERAYIERALAEARYNKTQAAKLLKMNRAKFLRRCEHLGVDFLDQDIEFLPSDDTIEFLEDDN